MKTRRRDDHPSTSPSPIAAWDQVEPALGVPRTKLHWVGPLWLDAALDHIVSVIHPKQHPVTR